MTIKILPTDNPVQAKVATFEHPNSGDTLFYYALAPPLSYRAYLVQIVKLEGAALEFNFLSNKDGTVVSGTHTIDLTDLNLVWGNPLSARSLPSTLKGDRSTGRDCALLFLSDVGIAPYSDAQAQSGGTGKWPLSGEDTETLAIYLSVLKKLIAEKRFTIEQYNSLKTLVSQVSYQ
jgi:hypothetical protein